MKAGWGVFLLFTVVFGVAFGAERIFVPDIVPIAFAEAPQPQWAVQTAFFLRTIELMAAAVATIALALLLLTLARQLLRHRPS
jgi:hypothetical protein